MDFAQKIVDTINDYLSNYILIVLLIAVGLYFTIRTRFVQVRFFGQGFKRVLGGMKGGDKKKAGISSFQALAAAIAAQVGTGNIVGACGAILIGGPGAIFWMWLIAFFGMATIYAEATLAIKTREVDADGNVVQGGPVRYIKHAFGGGFGKFLAGFFAVAAVIALGFVGAMVQSNSIAANTAGAFAACGANDTVITVVKIVMGVICAALAGLVLVGGTKRLASVTEKMVPVMASLYLIGGLVILAIRIQYLPAAFGMIFRYAFAPQAITGGLIGHAIMTALTQGAKRGLFSNEAGMGSTPHAHALADVKDPHEQGVSAMMGVFIDTFIVLTMTALIVISTLYAPDGPIGRLIEQGSMTPAIENAIPLKELAAKIGIDGSNMAQKAFTMAFGGSSAAAIIGSIFVAVCLFFFAFSTILSWNYFGKVNFLYLFGKKSGLVYTIIAIACVFLGSIFSNDLVWALTDMFNNLMVIPNAIALFALSPMVISAVKSIKKNK